LLQIFYEATLELSKSNVPTICKVLPLYNLIEQHLRKALANLELESDMYNLDSAIEASLDKLEKYKNRALNSDYVLLGAGKCYL
jgi:hypothetical protein